MLELAGGSPPTELGFCWGEGCVAWRPVKITNESWVGPILSLIAVPGCFEWLCCVLLLAYCVHAGQCFT